jgi:LmbE family N-acetylglucosaminyl deacetylase
MNAARAHARWRSLPFASLTQIVGHGAPLILAPHQDDESLGCGGLIAACAARGTPPVVAFLTDGALSHPGSRSHPPASLSRLRAREARVALHRLGVGRAVFLNAPDGAAPMAGDVFNALRATLVRLARGCTAVVTAWRGDPHCDHVAAARLAADVADRAGLRLLSYPVWGWELPDQATVPASSGRRLLVTARLGAKRRAIAAHASQHGRVIQDDPTGFRLPASLLAALTGPYEVYLR